MRAKNGPNANQYVCAVERNQNGKYSVRVRAIFGPGTLDAQAAEPGQNGQRGVGAHRDYKSQIHKTLTEPYKKNLLERDYRTGML